MKTPLYRILQQNLKNQINMGVYLEGDLLPSENELSEMHKLNRTTVRQALEELVREGFIIKKKGKGSLVQIRRPSLGLLSFKGFSEVISQTDKKVQTEILVGPRLENWSNNFFYQLNSIEIEAGAIYLKRLRSVNTDPVMLEQTWIPNLNLPRFTSKNLVQQSLFKTLSLHYQVEIISVDQEVRAVASEEEVASKLVMKKGNPVLQIFRQYGTNRPELFIYSILFCNTDYYAIGSFHNS
jgi:GntR family transcriptional regulator/GntR family frlABCD operon transcriptional regulator